MPVAGRAGRRERAWRVGSQFDPDLFATGVLPFIVIVAALLTAPVSALLLRQYRRAVLRAMAESGSEATPEPRPAAEPDAPPARALRVERVDGATGAISDEGRAAWRALSRALGRASVVYVLAGCACASVLTAAWIAQAGDGFGPNRFAWIVVAEAWPVVLTLELAVAARRRERRGVVVAYFAMLALVSVVALARSPDLTVGQLATFWLIANLPPTVVMLAFLRRRVRAVGPLVLAFMLLGVGGALALTGAVGASDAALRAAIEIADRAGLGANETLVALVLAGFVLSGAIGWLLLGALARAYQRRRMSDLALTLDTLWLTFAVIEGSVLASDGWPWLLSGLGAFAAWWLVTRVGFRLLPGGTAAGHSLLLLRVFALGARSERALDTLAQRWRRTGSIELMAGPDLVTSTVEPHEFLDYLGGRLSRRFVSGSEELERRVAERALGPDPDGRYRVNEFFCRADTWQPTMSRLADEADVVLMDLRSFGPDRQGCIFELERLLAAVPLARVLLVADDSTDEAFLEQTLASLWSQLPADSPNRALVAPAIRVFHLATPQRDQMVALTRLLVGVASG